MEQRRTDKLSPITPIIADVPSRLLPIQAPMNTPSTEPAPTAEFR